MVGGAVLVALGASYVLTGAPGAAPTAAPVTAPVAAHRPALAADVAPEIDPAVMQQEVDRAFAYLAGEDQHAERATASRSRPATAAPLTVWPAKGAMTGWFGEGRRTHSHPGIDLDGETGDPVVAAGPGVVVHAGPAPAGYSGYGTTVIIDHGGPVTTLYAHLSAVRVTAGQVVQAGDLIGAIGTTGNVTGSHLHFEVRLADQPVNPVPFLPDRRASVAEQRQLLRPASAVEQRFPTAPPSRAH